MSQIFIDSKLETVKTVKILKYRSNLNVPAGNRALKNLAAGKMHPLYHVLFFLGSRNMDNSYDDKGCYNKCL